MSRGFLVGILILSGINPREPINLPIDGVLDLHTFQPGDVKDLVPEYLAECRLRGNCSCHESRQVIRVIPCCSSCPDCKSNISNYYYAEHIKKCAEKKKAG